MCGYVFAVLDSRRVLVGTPGTKPQTHMFWLGPPAPNWTRYQKNISNSKCCDFSILRHFEADKGGGVLLFGIIIVWL